MGDLIATYTYQAEFDIEDDRYLVCYFWTVNSNIAGLWVNGEPRFSLSNTGDHSIGISISTTVRKGDHIKFDAGHKTYTMKVYSIV